MPMHSAPVVIKVGGNDLSSPGFVEALAEAVAQRSQKLACVVVHGGGRAVDRLLGQLNVTPKYVNGQRVTDEAALDVVEMVLSGQVNTQLVLALLAAGVDALGLSGVDRRLLTVEPWSPDLGLVGRVVALRAEVLTRRRGNRGGAGSRACRFRDQRARHPDRRLGRAQFVGPGSPAADR
jgi:acetylglutamate kinase